MTIHRVSITNFMGIAAREITLSAEGVLIEGGNGKGKTSVLKAIRAALLAQGVSPDAIRKGADSAEILIAYDDIAVRRLITQKGTSVTVTLATGERQAGPQQYLGALLGVAPLDPLDLFMERDPKKRRARILEALPVRASAGQFAVWLTGLERAEAEAIIAPIQFERAPDGGGEIRIAIGHGLDVIERARKIAYDRRTAANAQVKQARTVHGEQLALAAQKQAALAEAYARQGISSAPTEQEAALVLRSAQEREAEIAAAARTATTASSASAETRARIKRLRDEASARRSKAPLAPTPEVLEQLRAARDNAQLAYSEAEGRAEAVVQELARLQEISEELKANSDAAEQDVRDAERQHDRAEAEQQAIADTEARAAELEAATGPEVTPPSEEDRRLAKSAREDAEHLIWTAKLAGTASEAQAAAERAAAQLAAQEACAKALDTVVHRLTHDAPASLLSAGGIDGLAIDGNDVLLDGVALDRLSSAEQLLFAVQIARRLNARAKLLIVDGIERLDAEQLPRFIEAATRDGYQLIATRVTSGDTQVQPLPQQGGAS